MLVEPYSPESFEINWMYGKFLSREHGHESTNREKSLRDNSKEELCVHKLLNKQKNLIGCVFYSFSIFAGLQSSFCCNLKMHCEFVTVSAMPSVFIWLNCTHNIAKPFFNINIFLIFYFIIKTLLPNRNCQNRLNFVIRNQPLQLS